MSDTNDRSTFIRTFAKDVAAITGKTPVGKSAAVEAAAPATTTEEGVTLPVAEEPFFSVPKATREVVDIYREPEALPAMGELGKELADLAPVPTMEPAPAPIESVVSSTAKRSSFLERLEERIGEGAQMAIESGTPSVPVVPAVVEEPIPPPPIIPPPVFVPPPPPPAPIPQIQKPPAVEPARLHTYKTDFAERIDTQGASTFSVLAAQQDAPRVVQAATKPKNKSVALIAAGTLLIVLGAGGIYGAYWYVARMNTLPSALNVPSLVFADERVRLEGDGDDLMRALARASEEPLVDGNIVVTYLSSSTTTPRGEVVETPLAGGALIAALPLSAPEILLRNIAPVSTVGIIRAGMETRPFFIFRVTSYERTFAGMLAWEGTMGRDLMLLYPSYAPRAFAEPQAGTLSIGSSSPETALTPLLPLPDFLDRVVANHDVRVLLDTAGNTLMLYGYADKETLVIARDEAAFTALLLRLSASRSQ